MKSTRTFQPSWIELSKPALTQNIRTLVSVINPNVTPCFCVKANAYGHDLRVISTYISKTVPHAWLGVHSLEEAVLIRSADITTPLYIMGPLIKGYLEFAIRFDTHFVVYDADTLKRANREAALQKKIAHVHLKIETGNHRQGVEYKEALHLCELAQTLKQVKVEGISTHFANIEDISVSELVREKNLTKEPLKNDAIQGNKELLTEPYSPVRRVGSDEVDDVGRVFQRFLKPALKRYPYYQLQTFKNTLAHLEAQGYSFNKVHCANSAATLLFPETHFTMVRPGISLYGMWPSIETQKMFHHLHPQKTLEPVLTWKTRIGQIKTVAAGKYIGYGCTYKTKRTTKLAILPIGYSDGYDRLLSNKAYVLIHGKKAHVRGRMCMNMIMVDCTNIPEARVEDEVTLLGEGLTADQHASWSDTINYAVTTRIRERIPRILK